MKYLLIAVLLCTFGTHNNSSDLTIEIMNIEQTKGKIRIGVYNDADKFPKEGGAIRSESFEVRGKILKCVLKNLPYGEYAIALYHDINDDNVCNMNFVGMPLEPYGFSNNAKPKLSAPSFTSTKFKFNQPAQISISLQK
jgi:uncharacterized protein (DUF2141 family)